MKRVLLWGMEKCFWENIYVIKYYEMLGKFHVLGVTSNMPVYKEAYGYKYIRKNDIKSLEFDAIVVMTEEQTYRQIINEAFSLGITSEKIFNYRVLKMQGFDIDKYIKIRRNTPSIFSNNCWGGLTYHSLDLEFASPLINMFENNADYLKLLGNLKKYMAEELKLISTKYEDDLDIYYPIVKCGDITLHFNHYNSFEQAKLCWERRKKRINWDNLLVMMYTEERDLANEFIKLPYKRKVCFVPFDSDKKELIYIEFKNRGNLAQEPFWKIVNEMASGVHPYYNVLDLIGEGKFNKLENIRI